MSDGPRVLGGRPGFLRVRRCSRGMRTGGRCSGLVGLVDENHAGLTFVAADRLRRPLPGLACPGAILRIEYPQRPSMTRRPPRRVVTGHQSRQARQSVRGPWAVPHWPRNDGPLILGWVQGGRSVGPPLSWPSGLS
jgi:hypothetical protein